MASSLYSRLFDDSSSVVDEVLAYPAPIITRFLTVEQLLKVLRKTRQ